MERSETQVQQATVRNKKQADTINKKTEALLQELNDLSAKVERKKQEANELGIESGDSSEEESNEDLVDSDDMYDSEGGHSEEDYGHLEDMDMLDEATFQRTCEALLHTSMGNKAKMEADAGLPPKVRKQRAQKSTTTTNGRGGNFSCFRIPL